MCLRAFKKHGRDIKDWISFGNRTRSVYGLVDQSIPSGVRRSSRPIYSEWWLVYKKIQSLYMGITNQRSKTSAAHGLCKEFDWENQFVLLHWAILVFSQGLLSKWWTELFLQSILRNDGSLKYVLKCFPHVIVMSLRGETPYMWSETMSLPLQGRPSLGYLINFPLVSDIGKY